METQKGKGPYGTLWQHISLRWEMQCWAETQHRDGASSLLQQRLEHLRDWRTLGTHRHKEPEHPGDQSIPGTRAHRGLEHPRNHTQPPGPLPTAKAAHRTRGKNHTGGCTRYVGCTHTCTHPLMANSPFPCPLPPKCQKAAHLLPRCGWKDEWKVLTSAWCEDWSTAAMEPEELGSASARVSSMFSW